MPIKKTMPEALPVELLKYLKSMAKKFKKKMFAASYNNLSLLKTLNILDKNRP